MALYISLYDPTATYQTESLYSTNITDNLAGMALAASIYDAIWDPHRWTDSLAKDIIEPIEKGLSDMKARPDHYRLFNSANGWGNYDSFIHFIEEYLEALNEYPEAIIKIN